MAGQFATRTGWLTCSECQGRSFSDPTKAYHYPSCSKYRGWRFGYPDKDQELHARALSSRGHGCYCHETVALCDYCTWHIDQEDEG